MNEWIAIAAELFVAVAFGAMIFFAAVMAPLIFTKLEEETAGRFIREVFPRYYAFLAILCGIAAPCLASTAPVVAAVIATNAVGFLFARQCLMPRINDARDREKAGDQSAGPVFERGHRVSVFLNTAQLVTVLGSLIELLSA